MTRRRWYHRYYVVEVVPAGKRGSLRVYGQRRVVAWTWREATAHRLVAWYTEFMPAADRLLGAELHVERA